MKDFIKGYIIPFVLGCVVTGALLGVINLASNFNGW